MIKIGDKVTWGYWHWLNSVSKTWRIKEGIVTKILNENIVFVLFKGNKHSYKRLVCKLKKVDRFLND